MAIKNEVNITNMAMTELKELMFQSDLARKSVNLYTNAILKSNDVKLDPKDKIELDLQSNKILIITEDKNVNL